MKKQYLVLSQQNSRDLTVVGTAFRLLTTDPKKAYKKAKDCMMEKSAAFVAHVMVYCLESEREYEFNEMHDRFDLNHDHLVYILIRKEGCSDEPSLNEGFLNDRFRELCDESVLASA